MKITILGRTLSLGEGPTEGLITRAKAYQGPAGLDLRQDPTRTFQRMRNLRNIYKQGGYISTGIDLYPLYTFGEWYTLESDDEGKKEEIEQFLQDINFNSITTALMTDALTVRDGIAEIVMGRCALGQVPVNIVPRPAECFEINTDLSGKVLSYTQKYDNRGNSINPITLKPEQVLHYQFMSDPTSPYGVSLIERAIHDIKRDTRVIEAIANGICLHGTPKWHIQANSRKADAIPLSDTEWSDLETQFKDFNAKDQFITEGDILVEPKDTGGVANVNLYSDVAQARVIAALGVPAELLGLRQGTSDATAVSRISAFYKQVKLTQKDIETLWNVQIIDKITGKPGLVKMKLHSASIGEMLQKAVAVSQLRAGSFPDAIMDAKFAREWLNIPEDENPEEQQVAPEPQKDPNQLKDWLLNQVPGNPAAMPKPPAGE